MQNSQNTKLSPQRRNQILDLLIETLKPKEGICKTLVDLSCCGKITGHENDSIRNELSQYFLERAKLNYRYIKFNYLEFYFKRSDNGPYYFESYEERIEFLKGLKTA